MAPFASIAEIASLQFDAAVTVQQSDRLNRETIQALFDAGLCPDRETFAKIFPQEEMPHGDREGGDDERTFPNGSIIDILGEYRSGKKEIVIYERMCQLVAAALNFDFAVLTKVVIAHEAAHAVTHLGRDDKGGIWTHFDIAESEDTELFAQLYSLLHFKMLGDTDAVAVFRKLSEHQEPRYNSWRDYDDASLSDINQALDVARHKRPPDFIVQRSFMGFGINMMMSRSDITGNGMILGDGRVFYGTDWGLGFSRGEQAAGRVSTSTLNELRHAIEEVMRISEQTFGPQHFMDGGVTNLSISIGNKKRRWQANCGQWGRHESAFSRVEQLFRKAMAEATSS